MRYSLLSRFQGTLLGANIGYGIGSGMISLSGPGLEVRPRPGEDKYLVASGSSLIQNGGFDSSSWCEAVASVSQQSEGIESTAILGTDRLMAVVPVLLFYHEQLEFLRTNIYQISELLSIPLAERDGLLALGYAIAASLTERLNRHSLIGETIAYLQESPSPLIPQLATVETLLAQGASLERVREQLTQTEGTASLPFALGFYCLLSTLEDFRLSISRATRTLSQSAVTTVITGILSGVYNSIPGIPWTWQLGPLPTEQIFHLGDRLLATWSGVYDAHHQPEEAIHFRAVAAPNVIRPWQL
ncbi:ADP-ribosylglycohydrolase family protein [Phormidium pseudopriestleyi FRX01]|uniref:ADP-ribosylglycohydrolase family protein n=1 Tax=Phormidium pseudopriestleyi FRX01 TaxID=1759528 RepID=A0ABS3FPP5_9CYAN|nr:ADP-ribosylglycohydrolase family protein [Phormidium pseudopriestleyi]MBO0349018.1 ADP-ribosylglycohydrolase family protein [Phormidium pseudopriestleyi FRX01]